MNPAKGEVKHLRAIIGFLWPYRWPAAVALVAILFTVSAMLGMGGALKYLVDEGISKGNARLLDRAFMLLLGVTLLLAAASYTRVYLVASIGERVVADIRNAVYRHLISMHIGFFEHTRTGDLLSRLTTDTTLLQTVIASSLSMAVRNALLFAGGLVLLLITSTQLTFYVLLMLPLVMAPILLLGRRVRGLTREAQARVGDVSAQAEETLSAIRAVQALAIEEYEAARFAGQVDRSLLAGLMRIRLRALLMALVIMISFGAVMTVLWLGGRDVLAGNITAGDLSAFVFYSVVVAGAVGALGEVITDLQRAAGAAGRLSELLALETEVTSPSLAIPPTLRSGEASVLTGAPECNGGGPPSGGGEIRFEHVSFSYPSRPEKPAIADFTLDVAAGKTVALAGTSGSGKTTLFQLLLRFYDPSPGAILFGGVDIRSLPLKTLRSAIGIVPQDPMIFSGTARENIRLGKLDATEEEIIHAARAASAMEFLEKLPQGLDTHLGQKGVQLSGGQRQRLAIARAVIRNPRLLLLDEATSSLDSENEYYIQQALMRIMPGRTTFVIAHRLSTIIRADCIILLNEGRIEATGTHEELLAASPLYRRLAELQFKAA